jgi:hypothetical protein
MGSVREVFCVGIGCKDLVTGNCEDGEFVTCGVLKCPYSKDFVKGWYAGQKSVLALVSKRIEGVENPYSEDLDPLHRSGFEEARQAILDAIKEE